MGASLLPFSVLSHFGLELVPPRGEKNFKPRPQNRILVLPLGFLSEILTSNPVLFIWEYPPPRDLTRTFVCKLSYLQMSFTNMFTVTQIKTHFHIKCCAPELVFQLKKHLLRTLVVSFANAKETRPLGMRILISNNCIVLYGRWVPEISRSFNFDQPAPGQYNTPMARNPCNLAMSSHTVFQAPITLS